MSDRLKTFKTPGRAPAGTCQVGPGHESAAQAAAVAAAEAIAAAAAAEVASEAAATARAAVKTASAAAAKAAFRASDVAAEAVSAATAAAAEAALENALDARSGTDEATAAAPSDLFGTAGYDLAAADEAVATRQTTVNAAATAAAKAAATVAVAVAAVATAAAKAAVDAAAVIERQLGRDVAAAADAVDRATAVTSAQTAQVDQPERDGTDNVNRLEDAAGTSQVGSADARPEDRAYIPAVADTERALAAATSVEELIQVVVDHGLGLVAADSGGATADDDLSGVLRLSLSDDFAIQTRLDYGELPLDKALPGAVAARTGRTLLLPDRASGKRISPLTQQAYESPGGSTVAAPPLQASERLLGSAVGWTDGRAGTDPEVELLRAFAFQCALALGQAQSAHAAQAGTRADRRLSKLLQSSQLGRPQAPDDLQIAVRYSAAAQGAKVGGDWYDALVGPDGALVLAIGDCAGHDQAAAVAMASVRNLLRGAAYDDAPAAAVLTSLERTMAGLGVETLATAVLARVELPASPTALGSRQMRWSNAGHLPPLLHTPGGTTSLLRTQADLLLGLVPDTARAEHVIDLTAGSTVLLYTDGLVERRGEDLDVGLERLRDAVEELAALPLEQLCDALLERMLAGQAGEDDVALLALQLRPREAAQPSAVPTTLGFAEQTFAPETASVPAARHFLTAQLKKWDQTDLLWTAQLALTELATNCVLHAQTTFTVGLQLLPDGAIRLELIDGTTRAPRPRTHELDDTSGRGVALVAGLARSWGVQPHPSGKIVWCELVVGPADDLAVGR